MSTIQAIETSYAGCRFRSRLEARWAVFFDTLGIEWEYESEGYVFGDGTHYLPDFWLPRLRIWFEVKAEIRTIDTKWLHLHDELMAASDLEWHDPPKTASAAFDRILKGSIQACREIPLKKICDSEDNPCTCRECMAPSQQRAEVLQGEMARRALPNRTLLAGPIPRMDRMDHPADFACMIGPGSPHSGWAWGVCAVCGAVDACHVAWPVPLMCGHEPDAPHTDAPQLKAAYQAARSARFEHGESG